MKSIEKHHAVCDISDERNSGDGYWVYLKPGWCIEPELHSIHEETPLECLRKLKDIQRCHCADYCERGSN